MVSVNLEDLSIEFFFQQKLAIKEKLTNPKKKKSQIKISSLSNINLDIKNGDKIAILGNNGAGKTTLLKVIAGIYPPLVGKISLEGKVNYLIDIMIGIDKELNGIESIFAKSYLMGEFDKKKINSKIREIINFSELEKFINLPIKTYSSGMLVRLFFSIITSFESDILIIDEWLSVGDKNFQNKAEKKIKEMINSSKIFIFATHSLDAARNLCNRFLVLEKGKIINDTRNFLEVEEYILSNKE